MSVEDMDSSIHSKFGWPKEVSTIHVTSSMDGTQQPSLWYSPQETTTTTTDRRRRPLLIALHTWSTDYRQGGGQVVFGNWCIQQQWHFLHPNFRGPNHTRDACGSELAIRDVIDALQYIQEVSRGSVDEDRIYVVGVSGGGHMALLLASLYPQLWAGVSTWAAISDLAQWWTERSADTSTECPNQNSFQKYARNIESVLGGCPNDGLEQSRIVMEECRKRSPITYLSKLSLTTNNVKLDINAGITDGRHGGSVPFWHSLLAYDALLPDKCKRGLDWMNNFYQTQQSSPFAQYEDDPLYQGRAIHHRHTHDCSRLTIFEGGHEILHVAALNWLAHQCRGQPCQWKIPMDRVQWMDVDKALAASGK